MAVTGKTEATSVPWSLMAPHEAQAKRNHGGQSLARLAERQGLSAGEALAVVLDRPWEPVPVQLAQAALLALAAETARADREAAARQEAERVVWEALGKLSAAEAVAGALAAERDRLRAELEGVAADLEHSRERDSVTEEAVAELRAEIAALRAGAA